MKRPPLQETAKMAARLLFQGDITLSFDQLPFHFHDVSIKKRLNSLIQGMQIMKRPVRMTGIPPILQIEPSNICNLQCLTCATGAGIMKRAPVQMPFDMYQRIIDQVRNHVYLLVFWSWGEPFLNKAAYQMIRYAKEKGLLVHTSTNGHFFNTREQARKVIDSGLDSLVIAVDGLDQQTYEKYRKRGSLQTVIDSIENLVAVRSSLGVRHPRITLRFIVMKHNEHQIDQVKDFARDLGVDVVTFRAAVTRRHTTDFEDRLAPLSKEFQLFSPEESDDNAEKKELSNSYCHRPYTNLTIFSNGDIVACENDFNGSLPLGNVDESSIGEILSSSRAKSFFARFRTDLDLQEFCRECENRYIKGDTANVATYLLNREDGSYEKNN